MGLLDDAASMVSGRTSHHGAHSRLHRSKSGYRHHHKKSSRSKSRERSRSRPRSVVASIFGVGSGADTLRGDHRHKSSRRSESFFGLRDGDGHHHESKHRHDDHSSFFGLGNNASRGSFFGFGPGRSPSYYKRSPRGSFLSRAYKQLKRLIRDLLYYAKRHPAKVLMLVIMPLLTTGALTALLARFGLRLPAGLERMLGIAAKVGEAVRMASDGLGGGSGHSRATVERGRDGGMQWERRSVERDEYSKWGTGDGGGDGWADGLMKGVAKMFL